MELPSVFCIVLLMKNTDLILMPSQQTEFKYKPILSHKLINSREGHTEKKKKKESEWTAGEYLLCEDLLCEDSLHFAERTGLDGNLAGEQMGQSVHQREDKEPGGRLP